MINLNNKGFGLSTMIVFICIFIIFLLVVAFLLWNMDRGKESPNSSSLIDTIIINNKNA